VSQGGYFGNTGSSQNNYNTTNQLY